MGDIGKEEKRAHFRRELLDISQLNIPTYCEKCQGVMVFKGVGEYKCEDCGHLEYDDYGKCRNFIEKNPGATAAQVSAGTGVSQKAIRQMLKDQRLEISASSHAFLRCESCGANIRFGRLCKACETKYHRELEDQARVHKPHSNMSGFSAEVPRGEEGAKRFKKDW